MGVSIDAVVYLFFNWQLSTGNRQLLFLLFYLKLKFERGTQTLDQLTGFVRSGIMPRLAEYNEENNMR